MADRQLDHEVPDFADPKLQPKQQHKADIFVPIERFTIEGHRPPCDHRCRDTRQVSPDGFTVRLGHEIDCGPRGMAVYQIDLPAFSSEQQREAAWRAAIKRAHAIKAVGGSAKVRALS